jgi:hypothetical protein
MFFLLGSEMEPPRAGDLCCQPAEISAAQHKSGPEKSQWPRTTNSRKGAEL